MKITTAITIASSVLLAAGCAHETREARYDSSVYSPSYSASGGTESRSYSDNASTSASINQQESSQDPLVSQIRSSLTSHSDLAAIAPGIQISVNNGVVTLNGNVDSQEQKQNIESIVQQVSGVTTVNNQLQISSQTSVGAAGETKEMGSGSSSGAKSAEQGVQGSSQSESLSATSRTNENNGIYSGSENSLSSTNSPQGGEQHNDTFSPTSRANEKSSIFQGSETSASSTNDVQGAENKSQDSEHNESLTPTSRTNETSSVFSGSSSNEMGGASIKAEGGEQSQAFTPTSRTNDNSSRIYSSSTNGVGGSQSEMLTPTSDRPTESSSSQTSSSIGASGNTNSTGASQSGRYSTAQGGAMNIQVQGESSSDQSLGQQIRQDLSGNSSLTSLTSPLRIRVNNGVVTLQGSVRTQQQKQEVERAIQGVTGVTRVDNQLSVSTDQQNR